MQSVSITGNRAKAAPAPLTRRVSSSVIQPSGKAAAPSRASLSRNVTCSAVGSVEEKMTWNPINNKYFETFSYLQPLTDTQIKSQIDYLLRNNYIPCIEFAPPGLSYTRPPPQLDSSVFSGTYQNCYWPMWKLPMFGCKDAQEVMDEIKNCEKAYGECYIRVVGFDNVAQVQCVSFLVHRPPGSEEYASLDERRRG